MTRSALVRRLLVCLVMGMIPRAGSAQDQDPGLARELPRLRPTEPADAPATFRVQPGFRLELVAAEPKVASPVAAAYDAEGRLYVVEMRGYPYPEAKPIGRVRLLDDTDGDGTFDQSLVFADGLSWPTSVVPYRGGVFVAAPPDIVYCKDTDGDGVADERRVAFTGFGTENVQALVNGLLWGPDGWIYGVSGGNAGEIRIVGHPEVPPVSIRGRDFRFRPDGSAFEAASGGGQFGHAWDDWGHRFTCNNSNHIRQIVLPARVLARNPAVLGASVITDIAAEGGAAPVFRISPPEPWRVVRTRQRAADPQMARRLAPTELVPVGFFTSATGVTIYRGAAFPPPYRGNAFIGDVGGNLVHRKTLARAGAVFRATRADPGREFLASTDNWFRPVNFANTPDGTLLVLDMYRETIEHPHSIPEPILKHLDLTSGKDRGRIYRIVPDGFRPRARPGLSRATTATLVGHLADPDAWWRETAQRLLIERHDPAAVPLLRRVVRDRPSPLARVHALRTLDALGALGPEEVKGALDDDEPGVREQAVRLAGGRWKESPELLKGLLARAEDPDSMVRFQAAQTLGDVTDPVAIPALVVIATRDPGDRWVRLAVACALRGRARSFLNALADVPGFLASPAGRPWLDEVAVLIGAEGREADIAAVLDRFAAAGSEPATARAVVLGLGAGLQRSGGSLRALLEGPAGKRLAPSFEDAAHRAASAGEDVARRVEAIRLVSLGARSTLLEVLPPLLDAREPTAVQLAAVRGLAGLDDPKVGPAVVEHWRTLGPTVRREALEVLLARPERQTALLDAIAAGTIAPGEIEASRRLQLTGSSDRAVRNRARRLFGEAPRSNRAEVLARYARAPTLTADPERGRAVFRKACALCHRAEGAGADVGPDLATITGRSPEDLLIHILDPNREVAPTYLNYTVATTDGQVRTGLIAEESANDLVLKRAEGVREVVPRSRIEEIRSTGLSLMPEGLENEVSPPAMADLLAYLRSLAQHGGPNAPGR